MKKRRGSPDKSDSKRTKTAPDQNVSLGLQHFREGRLNEAAMLCRDLLERDPGNLEALLLLGRVALKLGKVQSAVALFARAEEMRPEEIQVLIELAGALFALGNFSDSEAVLLRAFKIDPNSPQVSNNLGIAIYSQNRPAEAIPHFVRATELFPAYAQAFRNLGSSLNDTGDYDGAEAAYIKALEISPDYHSARFSLGFVRLMKGDYRSGFSLYESRFLSGDRYVAGMYETLKSFEGLRPWNGEDLSSKRVIVVTEQGAGDAFMVMRYLPLLKELGPAKLVVCAEIPLVRVLALVEGVDQVLPKGEELPLADYDFYCPMMSLPKLFGTTLETIPAKVPYITPSPASSPKVVKELKKAPGVKVGLVWAGGRGAVIDRKRSMELAVLAPLFDVEGATFVSLQKGGEAEKEVGAIGLPIKNPMGECGDFLDTAKVIMAVDLVITVDTSVAHLAGALGKPVWLMNRFESEWRWLQDREDSPWYPTMRIFRQKTRGDWAGVVEEIRGALARFVLGS